MPRKGECKPIENRVVGVAGTVSLQTSKCIKILSTKWELNMAKTVGRIINEWMEQHREELPVYEVSENQMRIPGVE